MENIETLKKKMEKTKKPKFSKDNNAGLIDDSNKSKVSSTKSKIDFQTQFEQSSINYEVEQKSKNFEINLIILIFI